MLRISKQSRLNTDEIIAKASGISEKVVRAWTRLNEEAAASHFQGPGDMSP